MVIFMSKKAQAHMKERRKKKKLYEKATGEVAASSKKRPRLEETQNDDEIPANNRIQIPSELTPKAAKHFRKIMRRKARALGRDETKLIFLGGPLESVASNDDLLQEPRKKKKKQYPRLNELVLEEQELKIKETKQQQRLQQDDALSSLEKARYIACDCEMVGIGSSGKKSALARTSLVDWNGTVLLDTYVKVADKVTDFRTHVSGVRPKHLKEQAMDVTKCREAVAKLIQDKILVGHALKNDLDALFLTHPKQHIRDTATYRPFQRLAGSKWRPRKLRDLVKEHVGLTIQQEGQAHDSVTDARATMELFKSVRNEWEEELREKAARKKK
jgi:RNA exonuclease 4